MSQSKRFILRNPAILDNCIQALRALPTDSSFEVIIRKHERHRSDNQQGYYRVLLREVSDYTGYDPEELHDLFRKRLGLVKVIQLKESVEVPLSTSEMSIQQMSLLIEGVHRICAEELDLALPPPAATFLSPSRSRKR